MVFLIRFVFAVILTEAITEILSKSEIIAPLRKWVFNRKQNIICKWLHNLLDCGYCTSFWIGAFTALTFFFFNSIYTDIFFFGIIIHRLSNILHFVIDRINSNHE